ncbi:interferon gamma receptor 1-like isoform X2 [Pristis pectinata]|uniref:interferon gamma receptor 1-like isoform X2 n=1 Tax=Pristis pectinata TaxID=685728 RepID=UPI00223DAA53|nr:interferon gamma receptor 1-like isoform X2 [Pristis pectinata]XP_051880994.1 interferon gamma receptor 1-like isoform X2 [Pristis pectinata]
MWRSRARTPRPVLASVFCFCLLASPQSLGQLEFLPPVNLSIESQDFHTVLKWDVLNSSETTRFNVDFRDYETVDWKPVCLNISTHHCDLSNVFVAAQESRSGYYGRVQAVTALQESKFAYTNRFTFGQNATLGPPIVQLAAHGNQLTVEVKYPVHNSTSHNVPFNLLSYNVYCRHQNQTNPICLRMTPRKPLQQVEVPEGNICVSAEVHLSTLNLKGKKSDETCLRIYLHTLPVTTVVIPTILICVLVVISIPVVIYLFKCKKKLKLPKSLAHIVVSDQTYNVISPKSEESSVCVLLKPEEVTDVPHDSSRFQDQEEVINTLDNVDPGTINADEGSSELVNADLNDPYAAKIDTNGMDQKSVSTDNTEVGVSDLDSSHDLCKTHFDGMKQNYTADNWGYDKPQVPFNMF